MVFEEITTQREQYLQGLDTTLTDLIGVDHKQITPLAVLLQDKQSKRWALYPTKAVSDGVRVLSSEESSVASIFHRATCNQKPWLVMEFSAKDLWPEAEPTMASSDKQIQVNAMRIENPKHIDDFLFGYLGKFPAQGARIYNFGKITDRISRNVFQLYVLDFANGEIVPQENYQVRAGEWIVKQLTERTAELGIGVKQVTA